jgi:hypothetical protein
LLPKRRTIGPTSLLAGYGTTDTQHNQRTPGNDHQQRRQSTSSGVPGRILAGSRNVLGIWRTGLNYLSRFTGHGRRRSIPHDPEADPVTPTHNQNPEQ